MAWVDIDASIFKHTFSCKYDTDSQDACFVTLQYDSSAISPTEAKIRFKLNKDDSKVSGDLFDTFYLLVNPNDSSSRMLVGLKTTYTAKSPNRDAWPYVSSTILTLTKTYNAEKFTIPEFWLCNNANKTIATTAQAFYNGYKDSEWRGKNLRTTSRAIGISVASGTTVATSVGVGSVTITDNGNNTFSITGTKGANGTNNTASGPTLSWGYTNSYGNAVSNPTALEITTQANASRTVYAKSITGAEYGSDAVATAYKAIKQYIKPGNPGVPALSADSKKNGRLTVRQNWRYTWTAAAKTNDSSLVAGYRIYLYKNGSVVQGLTAGTGDSITLNASGTNEFLDRNSTSCAVTFDPVAFGFRAGDTVQLKVCAYAINGKSQTTWTVSSKTYSLFSSEAASAVTTVENAGIVRVKVGGSWKEGQVYVKVGGSWKEAVSVNTKIGGAWKESQ